jgi:hypothetical protein
MNQNAPIGATKRVPPRASVADGVESDDLDRSGNAILLALKEAAELAYADYAHICDATRDLSTKVRASEDHVQQLEAAARLWQDRAHAAEKWLQNIHQEVKTRFLGKAADPYPSELP